jgi:ribonuclease HI
MEKSPDGYVVIYTDGACLGNPGPGGYGAVLLSGGKRKELSGGFRLTTNNRMELMAAIAGLEALKEPSRVRLYSDSRYMVDSYTNGAAKRWQVNGWMREKKQSAQNVDLWERLLALCARHRGKWEVEGHAGDVKMSAAIASLNRPALPARG